MILISFSKYHTKSGSMFIAHRVYHRGTRWTPFVEITRRYKGKKISNA